MLPGHVKYALPRNEYFGITIISCIIIADIIAIEIYFTENESPRRAKLYIDLILI